MDISGDVDVGAASGAVGHTAAGQPAVFADWITLVIQTDLESLDEAVLVPVWNKQPSLAGDVPDPLIDVEAGDTLQVVKVREEPCQELSGGSGLGKAAVLVGCDPLLVQPPGQKVRFVLFGEFQMQEHIAVSFMPDSQGTGFPFRRFL